MMGRTHREATPPDVQLTKIEDPNIITQIREYQLITPLFGGGVKAGENDSLTPIRGTAIRGQLRYWWRATRGGKPEFEGNLKKMKEAEGHIWGTATLTKDQSPQKIADVIQIRVEIIHGGSAKEPFEIPEEKTQSGKFKSREHSENKIHSYAAFPIQPQDKDLSGSEKPPLKKVQEDIKFRLTISFPRHIVSEIEAALWAWETIGGVGARTRRGFGALRLLTVDSKVHNDFPISEKNIDVHKWMTEKLGKYIPENAQWPEEVPHLEKGMALQAATKAKDAKFAWYNLIKKLFAFRQTPFGRSGRSCWPEAETIRHLTKKRHYGEKNHPKKFPRAAFGLPIIFHFKDDEKTTSKNPDPQETILQPKGTKDEEKIEQGGRFASPLILKPLTCKNNQSVGIAFILEGSNLPAEGIILVEKDNKDNTYPVEAQLTAADLKQLPELKLQGQTDILKAFMNYLGENR
ncbi:type III-B CRISPR module RAMP protein Cmr1 [Dictyobacter arantiisoli]|uniref:Type III-B CRISPR module RAMP protein Cmr1 n=1 Tax=Dictyobacter arantiisoli TaxID=2014874 RepID=A0A5A5TGD9_9CHLR|nr:type III-B CRISPR module RAMP protein Cmr1 [Dictyobacter arantiisoli]GCF10226.1 type III-B CRISPR module RAMP protein Cmr1 [Dictyobacter arantiisoli]